jgi:hypothetical protein
LVISRADRTIAFASTALIIAISVLMLLNAMGCGGSSTQGSTTISKTSSESPLSVTTRQVSFTELPAGQPQDPYSEVGYTPSIISFSTADEGWGSSSGADEAGDVTIGSLRHYDKGAWHVIQTGDEIIIATAIEMLNPRNVWAVGETSPVTSDENIDKSKNPMASYKSVILHFNGTNWEEYVLKTNDSLNGITVNPAGQVFVTGPDGTFLRYDGKSWKSLTGLPGLLACDSVSRDECWAIGWGIGAGYVAHFKSGKWTAQKTGVLTVNSPKNLPFAISMVSNSDGWVVGSDGAILHYDGSSWKESHSPAKETLKAVEMVDRTHGWAVGENGGVYRYDGSQWQTYKNYHGIELASLSALSAHEVWIGGKPFTWFQGAHSTGVESVTYHIID